MRLEDLRTELHKPPEWVWEGELLAGWQIALREPVEGGWNRFVKASEFAENLSTWASTESAYIILEQRRRNPSTARGLQGTRWLNLEAWKTDCACQDSNLVKSSYTTADRQYPGPPAMEALSGDDKRREIEQIFEGLKTYLQLWQVPYPMTKARWSAQHGTHVQIQKPK